jgi:protein-S-isoprenylcysteine O-methyltransferase Ste14
MYTSTLVMFLTTPVILASVWSFLIMLLYFPIIVKRIRNEEKLLERELNGYLEYMQRVRWRLIPWIW